MLIDGASASRPLIAVEPVVVSRGRGLEEGVRERHAAPVEHQRQRTHGRDHRPGEHDQHDPVADPHLAPEAVRHEPEAEAAEEANRGAGDEARHAIVAAGEREHQRHEHRNAEHHHHGREHVDDRVDVLAKRDSRARDHAHASRGRAELHAWKRRPTAATCRRSVRNMIT